MYVKLSCSKFDISSKSLKFYAIFFFSIFNIKVKFSINKNCLKTKQKNNAFSDNYLSFENYSKYSVPYFIRLFQDQI